MNRPPIDCTLKLPVGQVRIVTADRYDLFWIDRLSKEFAWEIGYVPKAARRGHITNGAYWRVMLDGDDAGFVLIGGGYRALTRLSQVAISDELWRRGLGRATIDTLRRYAAAWHVHPQLTATVADRLPMLEVAAKTGGEWIASRLKVSKRGRRVHHWLWPQPQRCVTPPQRSGHTAAAGIGRYEANLATAAAVRKIVCRQ